MSSARAKAIDPLTPRGQRVEEQLNDVLAGVMTRLEREARERDLAEQRESA